VRTIVPGCITSARLHLDSRRYQQGHLSWHPQKEPRSTQAAKLAESLLALSQQKENYRFRYRAPRRGLVNFTKFPFPMSESQAQALWLGIEELLGIDLECVSEAC
jgi:hypothetical protein